MPSMHDKQGTDSNHNHTCNHIQPRIHMITDEFIPSLTSHACMVLKHSDLRWKLGSLAGWTRGSIVPIVKCGSKELESCEN